MARSLVKAGSDIFMALDETTRDDILRLRFMAREISNDDFNHILEVQEVKPANVFFTQSCHFPNALLANWN